MQIGPVYIPFMLLAGGLAVILIVIGVIAGRASRQRNQEQAAVRAEKLAARGWQYSMSEVGNEVSYHYSGTTDGVPWVVEAAYIRSGGSETHASWTRWHTSAAALPNGVIMLWPTKGRKFPAGTIFKLPAMTVKSMARQLVGKEAAKSLDLQPLVDANPVDVASEAINTHFYVLTHGGADPTGLLRGAESALTEYAEWMSKRPGNVTAGGPLRLIIAWDRGLTVLTEGATTDEMMIERIINLGTTLVAQMTKERA